MNSPHASHFDLQEAARQAMLEHGFEPEYPPEAHQQVAELKAHPPQIAAGGDIRDLRDLLWSSIDNDTSKDLDQIEVAERLSNGDTKVLVGIADVDAFVARDTPVDKHAYKETTTVFPLGPRLCWKGRTS
jgi:exoribonuclease R